MPPMWQPPKARRSAPTPCEGRCRAIVMPPSKRGSHIATFMLKAQRLSGPLVRANLKGALSRVHRADARQSGGVHARHSQL
jgi:hypothetical protein